MKASTVGEEGQAKEHQQLAVSADLGEPVLGEQQPLTRPDLGELDLGEQQHLIGQDLTAEGRGCVSSITVSPDPISTVGNSRGKCLE